VIFLGDRRDVMKIAGRLFLIFVAVTSVSLGPRGKIASSSSTLLPKNATNAVAQGVPFPFSIYPQKDAFQTFVDEPFLVLITAECPPNSPVSPQFELLSPTPGFVTVSPLGCRNEAAQIVQALVIVAPQHGDAGKYTVSVRATACTGRMETFTFKVKVKRAGS
jgi:hypothetical protein